MNTNDLLFSRDKKGQIRMWKIRATKEGMTPSYSITSGLVRSYLTGTLKPKVTIVDKGVKGKTAPEKRDAIMERKWKDKHDKKGCRTTIELGVDIEDECPTELQLDDKIADDRSKSDTFGVMSFAAHYSLKEGTVKAEIPIPCIGQPKLNGVRATARLEIVEDGEGLFKGKIKKYVIRSKNGLEYPLLKHLSDDIMKFLGEREDIVLDGEIYLHGLKLEEISSAANKENVNTKRLQFQVFDLAIPEVSQYDRLYILAIEVKPNFKQSLVKFVQNKIIKTKEEADKYYKQCIEDGFEGSMYKHFEKPYSFGYRVRHSVKRKTIIEIELPITKIIDSGKDRYLITENDIKNYPELVKEYKELLTKDEIDKAQPIAMFCFVDETGGEFDMTPAHSKLERAIIYLKRDQYLEKSATLRFHEYTKYGVPKHGVAIIRDYE